VGKYILNGEIIEVHCTYDPATKGGDAPDNRKVKSTIHWVSAKHAVEAEVRLYDHLFLTRDPNEVEEGKDFKANLNPNLMPEPTATAWCLSTIKGRARFALGNVEPMPARVQIMP
jgi:hypothetical protein